MSFRAGCVSDGWARKQKISHGITRKEDTSFRAGCVSDGIKNKHLPRINTELHGKDRSRDTEGRISGSIATEGHGKTRKEEEAEELATDEHGISRKENTS